METLKEEKIQGKYGILSRLTGNKFEVIGGHTGAGKSYYIMRLIAKLAANGKITKVFLNEDHPNSYLRRLCEVNNLEELRGRISICTLSNRGENPEELAELITNSSLEYDVVIVDSILHEELSKLDSLMGNIESKVIFVTQLNMQRLTPENAKSKREVVAKIAVSTPILDNEEITDEDLANYKSEIECFMKSEVDSREAKVEVEVYVED